MHLVRGLLMAILASPTAQVVATLPGNDLRGRTNDGLSSISGATSLFTEAQSSTISSTGKALAGDTVPIMTGTDMTTVQPGVPPIQPSFSSISGTWSDSFMSTRDKASASEFTSSVPMKDQTPYSTLGKYQTSTSVATKDQTTSSSVPTKDLTASASDQSSKVSIPTSGKDSITSPQLETSNPSSVLYISANGLRSSTMPSVVIYSFTLPPSSAASSGVSSKPETSSAVVISSFTVPSIIYAFTLPSSTSGTTTPTPISGPSPTKSESYVSTTGSGQSTSGRYSTSVTNRPYYNATSSVVPVWTPELLGNAYGGGFINTPSIYVTRGPSFIATATSIPPGYGFSLKPETSQSTDRTTSIGFTSASLPNDKTGSGGSSSTQIIASSGSGTPYTTDKYGIPTSGTSSTTGSTDCCRTLTTFSVGQIDNSGTPVSVPVGGSSTPDSSPTSYTFGIFLPTPITTALFGGNNSLSAGNGSNNSIGASLNPTALPEFSGFARKNTIGFTAGLLGILVFVFLI